MNRRARICISRCLALLIAIAPVTLAAPAAAMAVQMSMAGDANSGDCCPGNDGDRSACPISCVTALSHAMMPAEAGQVVLAFGCEHWKSGSLALPDHPRSPDPPPPKPASRR